MWGYVLPKAGREMFLLRVREPGRDETVVPMRGDQLTIGRSPSCRLSFPQQKALSRTHAQFVRDGDGWIIEDLRSSNGTLLNGSRLEGKRSLEAGDSVRLGELELLFEPVESASGLVGAEFESDTGAAVVLFTDGITEARGSGREEFGPDRISEVFRARNGASATEVLESLDAAVKTWLAGAHAHDDVTAVALVRDA